MQFKDELNPIIWDKDNDNQMRPEVNAKLREIADAFIEYIEIPEEALIDVVVTGSSASYNYNEHSDLDLHIIVDYEKIHEDCPLVEGYLGALKNTFNKEHDIFIKDIPVELYAEKQGQGTVHNGLYSVWKEEWIDRPEKIEPTDNDAAVEAKYQEIKEMVDKCNDSETATELLDKIYTMRKAGLATAGEFCTENLAFKKLRNEGCMDKLRQIKKEQIDKQLSLESYNEEYPNCFFEFTNGQYTMKFGTKNDKIYICEVISNKSRAVLTIIVNGGWEKAVELKDIYKDNITYEDFIRQVAHRYSIDLDWDKIHKQLSLESYNEDNTKDSVQPRINYKDYIEDKNIEKQIRQITKTYIEDLPNLTRYMYKKLRKTVCQIIDNHLPVGVILPRISFSGTRFWLDTTTYVKESNGWVKINTRWSKNSYGDFNWGVTGTEKVTEEDVYTLSEVPEQILGLYEIFWKKKGMGPIDIILTQEEKTMLDKFANPEQKQIDKQLSLESYNEDNEAPKTLDYFINKLENRYPIDFEQRELGLYIFNSKQTVLSWDDEFKLIKAMRRGWKEDNDTQKYYAEKSLKSTIKEANKIAKNLRKQAKEQKNKNESIKESLQDEYKQAFDLLVEGTNQICLEDSDTVKEIMEKFDKLKTIKSDKLKLKKAKVLLLDISGYMIDEKFDDYQKKIDKFMNNSKNESIKESEDELDLEEKLIEICKKDGWNHINGRAVEMLEKDTMYIDLYVDEVDIHQIHRKPVTMPLNTEKDLQKILDKIKQLSNKNESIKENKMNEALDLTEKDIEQLTKHFRKTYSAEAVENYIESLKREFDNIKWYKKANWKDAYHFDWEPCSFEEVIEGTTRLRALIFALNTTLRDPRLPQELKGKHFEDGFKAELPWPEEFNFVENKMNEAEGIYKPSLILEAYKKEQEWLKSLELGEDERAPEIMLFIIENDKIKDTKLIKREDVYTYKPEENEYYLDMFRDSGDVLTDYNLEPAQKLVDRWNEFKKEESMENKNEDVATLMDKVDAADAELKELIKSLSLREELESLIEKALEE